MRRSQNAVGTHARNILVCVAAENTLVSTIMAVFDPVGSVSQAGNCLDAVRKLDIAPFDIVFLDEHLPGLAIWGLVRLIRNGLYCSTPPLLIMACDDEAMPLYQAEASQRSVGLYPYSKIPDLGRDLAALLSSCPRARVLVVDDDARSLRLATDALSAEFDVSTAMDAHSALTTYRAQQFDLVILDLNLPDGSGQDLLQCIKNDATPPPIIVMTGEASPRIKLDLMSLGAYNYFTKPFSLQKLRADCRLALDSCAIEAARKSREHLNHVQSLLVAADRKIACGQIQSGVINLRTALRRGGWAQLTPEQLARFLIEVEREEQYEGDLTA